MSSCVAAEDCTVRLWLLLGITGRFIRVQMTRGYPFHPTTTQSAQPLPPPPSSPTATAAAKPTTPPPSNGSSPAQRPKLTVSDVASFLQDTLRTRQCNAPAPKSGTDSREDEVVEVDVPVVQMDFFDILHKTLAEPEAEVLVERHYVLFCEPASAEDVLADAFPSSLCPTEEPTPVEDEPLRVGNNLLSSLQVVRRIADHTLLRCQALVRSVEAAITGAKAKVGVLQEADALLLSSGASDGARKESGSRNKRLRAGIKVAMSGLERAEAAHAAANEIVLHQRNLLKSASLGAGFPGDNECQSNGSAGAAGAAKADSSKEREAVIRASLVSELASLRECMVIVKRATELLDDSTTSIGMANMVYERFEDVSRQSAAAVHAQSLLHRRAILEKAVRALLSPLEAVQTALVDETERLMSGSEFALLPQEQQRRLREASLLPLVEAVSRRTAEAGSGATTTTTMTAAAQAEEDDEVQRLLASCGLRLPEKAKA